jgi:hypothetical protein
MTAFAALTLRSFKRLLLPVSTIFIMSPCLMFRVVLAIDTWKGITSDT